MKESIYEKIKKINHLLFLVLCVSYIFYNAASFLSSLRFSNNKKQELPVIDSSKVENKELIETNIGAMTIVRDYFVFDICKTGISSTVDYRNNSLDQFYGHERSETRGLPVNILFIDKKGKTKTYLFSKDKLILEKKFSGGKNNPIHSMLNKNIYTVIENDTNKNGMYDNNDVKSLFLSDYNGKNLTKITDNIDGWNLINSENIYIIKKNENGDKNYFTCNIMSGEIIQILDAGKIKSSIKN